MPDNVGYTPGTGATIAADDIGGNLFQRVKLIHGADGINDGDVSSANGLPVQGVGELVEAIEAMRFAIATLTRTIGMALPNASGFPIMEARSPTAGNFNVTLGSTTISSGTITTVSTVTNQSQLGGFATNDQIPALMKMQADNLRRNISVT
jgi:hypothetical protein